MGDKDDDIIEDEEGAEDGAGTSDDDTGGNGDGDGEGQDDDKGDGADDKGAKPKPKEDKDGEDDDTPPPVRKTASDYYKERQDRKAAKKANSQKDDDKGKNGNDIDDDDDEVDPEDEELISKVVERKFKPVLDKIAASEEEQEAKAFFEENPEFKAHETKILKWWKDPSRRHLPISTVALEAVGYKNLIKLGAQKEREAADKAKKTASAGANATKTDSGKKDVWGMSKNDFAAKREEVLRKRQG